MARLTNGGIVGKLTTTPTLTSAVGKWNTSDQFIYKYQNLWTKDRIPPVTTNLLAVYDGDSWNGTSWQDIYGSYHATTTRGTITSGTTTGNGASGTFTAISGNTSAGLRFPSGILPATYTLFYVMRITSGTRRRVVTGFNNNWLSGTHGVGSGVAYHEGWLTATSGDPHGTNWFYSTDQNSLYRSNGTTRGTSGGSASTALSINYGTYAEYSNWSIPFLAVYSGTMSSGDYLTVESWMASKFGI